VTLAPSIRLSTAEITPAVPVRKPKNTGDTYSIDCNVASPGRLLDSNGKGTPTSLTRHTIIHQPATTFPNYSQPNQEPHPCRFPRTKLSQVGAHLQKLIVAQVAAIRNCACPLKMAEPMSPIMGFKTHHSNVGPLHTDMATPQ
jgi:hypothetical protein